MTIRRCTASVTASGSSASAANRLLARPQLHRNHSHPAGSWAASRTSSPFTSSAAGFGRGRSYTQVTAAARSGGGSDGGSPAPAGSGLPARPAGGGDIADRELLLLPPGARVMVRELRRWTSGNLLPDTGTSSSQMLAAIRGLRLVVKGSTNVGAPLYLTLRVSRHSSPLGVPENTANLLLGPFIYDQLYTRGGLLAVFAATPRGQPLGRLLATLGVRRPTTPGARGSLWQLMQPLQATAREFNPDAIQLSLTDLGLPDVEGGPVVQVITVELLGVGTGPWEPEAVGTRGRSRRSGPQEPEAVPLPPAEAAAAKAVEWTEGSDAQPTDLLPEGAEEGQAERNLPWRLQEQQQQQQSAGSPQPPPSVDQQPLPAGTPASAAASSEAAAVPAPPSEVHGSAPGRSKERVQQQVSTLIDQEVEAEVAERLEACKQRQQEQLEGIAADVEEIGRVQRHLAERVEEMEKNVSDG